MTNIGVMLTNGSQHEVVYEKGKEDFMDLVKFSRDSFIQDTNGYYILVSSISVFKFKDGGKHE
jgi:hypothetical protein